MKDEAYKTAWGLYHVIYESKGYWFRTPEAWDITGNFVPPCTCGRRAFGPWRWRSLHHSSGFLTDVRLSDKESRMRFVDPTKPYRKSGGWGTQRRLGREGKSTKYVTQHQSSRLESNVRP